MTITALHNARLRRDKGIARSALRTHRVNPSWLSCAQQCLKLFVTKRHGKPFIGEDVVAFSATRMDAPRDLRAWGCIFRKASKDGLIKKTGGTRKAKSSNLSPKILWRGVPR